MGHVFVSYARDDDEPFARRLAKGLAARGIAVWWDRQAMASRGLTFMREIRDAIAAADRLVLVLGPIARSRPYVEAEWRHALREGVVVTPLLRLGDYGVVPEALRALHCADVRRKAPPLRDRMDWRRITAIVGAPVPPLGALHGVPRLPTPCVERPDALDALRARVLVDALEPIDLQPDQRITAITGMTGVGKSVLAALLAHEADVRRSFPDGVHWFTVGRDTAPLAVLTRIGRGLGDAAAVGWTDIADARERLERRLARQRCLLVLDDVWDPALVTALHTAAGRLARILVTSQKRLLLASVGVQEVPLDVWDEASALELLAGAAGAPLDALPAEASAIVRACGRLPLALSMIGAMVRAQADAPATAWAGALARLSAGDLDSIDTPPLDYAHATLDRALRIAYDDLDAEHRRRHADLLAVPADVAAPGAMLRQWWAHEGLREADGARVLSALVNRHLLRAPADDRYTLHDVHRAFLAARAPDAATVHARWLAAFAPRPPLRWADVEDDGYLHDQLVHHLAGARDAAALRTLIDPDWRRVRWRDAGFGGAAFLADLERAERFEVAQAQPDLAWLARLRMLAACTIDEASSWTDDQLRTLLRLGRGQEALAYAQARADIEVRFDGLLALADEARASPDGAGMLEAACRAIERLPDAFARVSAVVRIAPLLADGQAPFDPAAVLQEAVATVFDDARHDVLRLRATDAWLALGQPAEADALAKTICDSFSRVLAWLALAAFAQATRDVQGAVRHLERAETDALQDARMSRYALLRVAAAWLDRDPARAKAVATKALAEPSTGADGPLRAWIHALAAHGDDDGAEAASQHAVAFQDVEGALGVRVAALAERGHFEAAEALLPRMRSAGVNPAAIDLATRRAAVGGVDAAERAASSLPEGWRAEAIASVAAALPAHDHVRAQRLLATARQLAETRGDRFQLEAVARCAAALGAIDDAVALAQRAQAFDLMDTITLERARGGAAEDAARHLMAARRSRTLPARVRAWSDAHDSTLASLTIAGCAPLAFELHTHAAEPWAFGVVGWVHELIRQRRFDDACAVAPVDHLSLAIALARAGDARADVWFAAAEATIASTPNARARDEKRLRLLRAQVVAGRHDEVARLVEPPSTWPPDLIDIVRRWKLDAALAEFDVGTPLEPLLVDLARTGAWHQADYAVELAKRLAEWQRLADLRRLAACLRTPPFTGVSSACRAKVACHLAAIVDGRNAKSGGASAAQPAAEARALLEAAEADARAAETNFMRDDAMCDVARCWMRLAQVGRARRLADAVERPQLRLSLLADLGWMARGDPDLRDRCFDEAEAAVERCGRSSGNERRELAVRCLAAGAVARCFELTPRGGIADAWRLALFIADNADTLTAASMPALLKAVAEAAGWDHEEWAALAKRLQADAALRVDGP